MCRRPNSNTKLPLAVRSRIPRREPWGKEQSANQAFSQAQGAFWKHNWRVAREVSTIKVGE